MNRTQQIQYLIHVLLNEMPSYQEQARAFPQDELSQRRLLRSLMNVRPPVPASDEFLKVQDAYLKLWRKRDELDIRTNPEAYCVSLIRRLCLDQLRSSRHEAEETLEDTLPLPADDDPGQRLEQRDETVRLKQLIAALPPTQRRVLWLRDVDERSFDEIEETTGLNAVNIRATLSRARKKIREQFKRITER